MPAALDQNLGDTDSAGAANVHSSTLTTSATAAAGSVVVFYSSYFIASLPTTITVSDTGGSYTLLKRQQSGSDWFEIWARAAASGLPSGSVITETWNGTVSGTLLGAESYTGVATPISLVASNGSNGTGASWSSGSATNTGQADALYVGGSGNEDPTNPTTSTPTSGVEVHDRYRAADQQGFATGFKAVSVVASDVITGTFSNTASTNNTGALAILAASTSTPAQAVWSPGRMPLGV